MASSAAFKGEFWVPDGAEEVTGQALRRARGPQGLAARFRDVEASRSLRTLANVGFEIADALLKVP